MAEERVHTGDREGPEVHPGLEHVFQYRFLETVAWNVESLVVDFDGGQLRPVEVLG